MLTFRVNESMFINTLLSWLPTPSRRGNLWHFNRQNNKYFTSSRIFYPTKMCFTMYHQLFCEKLKEELFSKAIDDFQKNIGCGVRSN